MVQIIAGKMGKGKTKFLLEKANVAVKECKGSLVYLAVYKRQLLCHRHGQSTRSLLPAHAGRRGGRRRRREACRERSIL